MTRGGNHPTREKFFDAAGQENPKMSTGKKSHRCKAKAKSGKPCQAAPTAGGLCFFHANPDRATELGRIGGKRNRHASGENADSPPTLNTSIAVLDTVARLIADVFAGRIDPRTAACLTALLSLQLRGLVESKEIADLQRQLDELQNPSAEPEDPLEAATRPIEITDSEIPILEV
jgi:hypothetical protein